MTFPRKVNKRFCNQKGEILMKVQIVPDVDYVWSKLARQPLHLLWCSPKRTQQRGFPLEMYFVQKDGRTLK